MPNGGADCCGTCWFNKKNKGESGFKHAKDPEQDFCIIRNLAIENSWYTYCANHPLRFPDKMDIPLGPVYIAKYSVGRVVWIKSPDSEEIRVKLLEMLKNIKEQPLTDDTWDMYLDHVVIAQLSEFGERRAIDDLKRVAAFDLEGEILELPHVREMQSKTIRLAQEALDNILKPDQ